MWMSCQIPPNPFWKRGELPPPLLKGNLKGFYQTRLFLSSVFFMEAAHDFLRIHVKFLPFAGTY
jgi:hypothetical protein